MSNREDPAALEHRRSRLGSGSTLVGGSADDSSSIASQELASGYTRRGEGSKQKASSFLNRDFTKTLTERIRKKDTDSTHEGDHDDTQHRAGLRLVHSSPEPLIDLIFVHGLKGHPVKTWRESGQPQSFWPQYWLPADPRFVHANIHTFGYEADVARGSSMLKIHDFGTTLFEEMRNSLTLSENKEGPIILLGHSLGGLVIKKAFLFAEELPSFRGRIRTLFFFGTPHGGSDMAKVLNNILSATLSSRSYMKDLEAGSSSVQLINDEFGRRAHTLPIFTFFEARKSSLGLTSDFLVPKDSAVLGPGFINERVQYLEADHRGLVKFPSPSDDNYAKVSTALSSAIRDQLEDVAATKQEETRTDLRTLKSWLALADKPPESHHGVEGSCSWFDDHPVFQRWIETARGPFFHAPESTTNDDMSIIWVHANPGTGKSFLASHVLAQLRSHHLECSSYFWHADTKASRSLGDFLRSIAFQMASNNQAIRRSLLQLYNEGSNLNFEDDRSVWLKLFQKGIFQAPVVTPQFWVVDGLDECGKYKDFFAMLKGEQPSFPFRIFITSRNMPDIHRLCRPLESTFSIDLLDIPTQSSMGDIERYINSRMDSLSPDNPDEGAKLAEDILRRSGACFLWVRLVMDKLETVYSTESKRKIIEELPEGMLPYYQRTIQEMCQNTMEKHISKAVLLWTAGSTRRMTTSELSGALKLDIDTDLPSAKTAIEGLCGQLVVVDNDSDTVKMVHPTAREFLLTEAAGEFQIVRIASHDRMAMACFKSLSGPQMQQPRSRRMATQRRSSSTPFLEYALTQFSEHVYSASAESENLLSAVHRFFQANALSWIERMARKGQLQHLIRTSRNLKSYLDRRAKYMSPLNQHVKIIDGWSTDLIRLVTTFGEALVQDPLSIYFLIPPLCPEASQVYTQFGRKPGGLIVVGSKSPTWDDCIASITFGKDDPVAVACGDAFITVSMASGGVALYNQQSCQPAGILSTQWPVDMIRFGAEHLVLVTIQSILVQDFHGNPPIWEKNIRSNILFCAVWGKRVFTVNQNSQLVVYNLLTGHVERSESYRYKSHDTESSYNRVRQRAPAVAAISPDMETLAMGFRGGTVCLWDLSTGAFIDWAREKQDWVPAKIVFNPNPEVKLLLVAYVNNRMSLFDSWEGHLVLSREPEIESGVLTLATSLDGRTFATVNALGALQIWDFESLTLLYHLDTPTSPNRSLVFTSAGNSIVDLSSTDMHIWSPAALVRKNTEEDESISDGAPHLSAQHGIYEPRGASRVTAVCTHPKLSMGFMGTSQGAVYAFSTKTGKHYPELYVHSHQHRIMQIACSASGTVASSDDGKNVLVWQLQISAAGVPKATVKLLDLHSALMKQICYSSAGNHLLLGGHDSSRLYNLVRDTATLVGVKEFTAQDGTEHVWTALPNEGPFRDHFVLVSGHRISIFQSSIFPSTKSSVGARLRYELDKGYSEQGIVNYQVDPTSRTLVLNVLQDSGLGASIVTYLFDLSKLFETDWLYDGELEPTYRFASDFCSAPLGLSGKSGKLVFIDNKSWVSTLDLRNFAGRTSYLEHFYIPKIYLQSRPNMASLLPVLTAEGDVVFPVQDKVTIIKKGFEYQSEIAL